MPWLGLAGLSWRELGRRLWHESRDDKVLDRAAGLAFWFLLGFFPMLLFVIEISTMLIPGAQDTLLHYLQTMLPSATSGLIRDVLNQTRGAARAWIPLLFALWSASSATSGLIDSLNEIYDLHESRPLWKQKLLALVLAVGMGALILIALAVVIFGSVVLNGSGSAQVTIWHAVQYPAAAVLLVLALLLVYRYAPNVDEQKWKWLVPGSIIAGGAWVLMSYLFNLYVNNFSNFGLLYGSVGTLVVLMFWFYLSAIVILVGGEINEVIESAAADRRVPGAKRTGEKTIRR